MNQMDLILRHLKGIAVISLAFRKVGQAAAIYDDFRILCYGNCFLFHYLVKRKLHAVISSCEGKVRIMLL